MTQRGVETAWVLVLKCGYIVFNVGEGGDKTEGNIRVLNFSTFRENSLLTAEISVKDDCLRTLPWLN